MNLYFICLVGLCFLGGAWHAYRRERTAFIQTRATLLEECSALRRDSDLLRQESIALRQDSAALRHDLEEQQRLTSTLDARIRQLEQIAEALGDDNRYFASIKLGHYATDKEALMHYAFEGGAENFAEHWITLIPKRSRPSAGPAAAAGARAVSGPTHESGTPPGSSPPPAPDVFPGPASPSFFARFVHPRILEMAAAA